MASIVAENVGRNKIHPKKFALWAACASITMMFAALTSAYMVRQSAGNWLEFPLPTIFFVNTVILLASSASLHGSYLAFKGGKEGLYKGLLVTTLILGLAFVYSQYEGWVALKEMGVPLKLNPSGDFVYVISGIHAAHVIGGIAAIVVATIMAFSRAYRVTPARKLRFEMTLTYWHFVDFLWIYLMIFWIMQR